MEHIYKFNFQNCPESIQTKNYDEFHKQFWSHVDLLPRKDFFEWLKWDGHVLHMAMILTPKITGWFRSYSRKRREDYTHELTRHWPNHKQLIQLLFTDCDRLMRNLTSKLVDDYYDKYMKEKEFDTYLRKRFPIYVQTGNCISDNHLTTEYIYDTAGGQQKLAVWKEKKMIYQVDFKKKSHLSKIRKINIPSKGKYLMQLPLNDACVQLCIQYLCSPIVRYNGY